MMRAESALTRAALVEVGEGSSGGGNESKQVLTTSGNNACEKSVVFFPTKVKKVLMCSRIFCLFVLKDE